MHSVGNVSDGSGLGASLGPDRLPHGSGHLSVATAHRVRRPTGTQGKLGHSKTLGSICSDATRDGQKIPHVNAELSRKRPKNRLHRAWVVLIIARCDRGVGGED